MREREYRSVARRLRIVEAHRDEEVGEGLHLPSREISIELITSDRKLEASREDSK